MLFSLLLAAIVSAANEYVPFQCNAAQCTTLAKVLSMKPAASSSFVGFQDVRADISDFLVSPLKHPKEYTGPFLGNARGTMIFGPPGVGKTYLIRTLVPELQKAGWEAWLVRPSDVKVRAWYGESAQRFECIFQCARKKGKVMLVFDEGESLLRDRSDTRNDNSELVSVALNQLNDIDNFAVVVLTNVANQIDGAIRRRVGFQYCYRLPTPDERWQYFNHLLRLDADKNGERFKSSISKDVFVEYTNRFSNDDVLRLLQYMVRRRVRAVRPPLRRNANSLTSDDIADAIKVVRPTSRVSDLKQYATYAEAYANPCFKEYASMTSDDVVAADVKEQAQKPPIERPPPGPAVMDDMRPHVESSEASCDITFSGGSSVPPGTVVPFAGRVVPKGWHACLGQKIQLTESTRALYEALYGKAQQANGFFVLPDLRGRVVVGVNQAVTGDGRSPYKLFETGGFESQVITHANLPNGLRSTSVHGVVTGSDLHRVNDYNPNPSRPLPVMQPYLALTYVIKE